MITGETAQRIVNISNEIDDCKKAIALFAQKEPEAIFHVFESGLDDEGLTFNINNELAASFLEEHLLALEKEYKSLNEKAAREAA